MHSLLFIYKELLDFMVTIFWEIRMKKVNTVNKIRRMFYWGYDDGPLSPRTTF